AVAVGGVGGLVAAGVLAAVVLFGGLHPGTPENPFAVPRAAQQAGPLGSLIKGTPVPPAPSATPSSTFSPTPTASSSPSPTPSTATSSALRSTPRAAARMAMRVASQVARAARNNQPGPGVCPPPPTDVGMSVVSSSPSGPFTLTWRPSTSVAVAAESV